MQIDWEKVRKIPRWWRWLPFFQTDIATTVYPYVYLPLEVFVNLHSENPDTHNLSILIHENMHLDRQVKHGVLVWNLKYIFFRKFRLAEELEAIRVQMIYLKENNLEYDIERKAKQFASSGYLWVSSQEKARRVLVALWDSI